MAVRRKKVVPKPEAETPVEAPKSPQIRVDYAAYAAIVAVGIVGAAFVLRTGATAPAPDATPTTEYQAEIREAVGGNTAGTLDEYAAGILGGLADKIDGMTTGKQVAALATALAKVGGAGGDAINLAPVLKKVGLIGLSPSEIPADTKTKLVVNLRTAADAAEAL